MPRRLLIKKRAMLRSESYSRVLIFPIHWHWLPFLTLASYWVAEQVAIRRITFWRNGFSFGEGGLMSYTDPQHSWILEQLRTGYVHALVTYAPMFFSTNVERPFKPSAHERSGRSARSARRAHCHQVPARGLRPDYQGAHRARR